MYKNGILETQSTLDLVIASENTAEKLTKIEVRTISAVYDEEASYAHIPIVCEFAIKPKEKGKEFFS